MSQSLADLIQAVETLQGSVSDLAEATALRRALLEAAEESATQSAATATLAEQSASGSANAAALSEQQAEYWNQQAQQAAQSIDDPAWGEIQGNLADQSDLQAALNGKAESTHSHGFNDLPVEARDTVQNLEADSLAETAPPSAYPIGVSLLDLHSAFVESNWPTVGTHGQALTIRTNNPHRHAQYVYAVNGEIFYRGASASDAWTAFVRLADRAWVEAQNYLEVAEWSQIEGKPSTFPPSEHTHSYADLPITEPQVNNWDTAHGWGDHAQAGYASQASHDRHAVPSSATTLTYDAEGRVSTITETVAGDPRVTTIAYDPTEDRVESVTSVYRSIERVETLIYAANGNIEEITVTEQVV